MRLIRWMIFIIAIFIFFFVLGLLLPSKVTVSKSVLINATTEKVSNQLVNFGQWKNWYPGFREGNVSVSKGSLESETRKSVTIEDKQGRIIRFNIIDIKPGSVEVEVRSSSSTKVGYQFIFTTKMNRQTQLTWNINADLGWYPWKRIRGIFLEKFSGAQYEASLSDLKKAAEK